MPAKDYHFQLFNQNLFLNPQRCLYWLETGMLMAADLHLGKAGHFRKAGIPIPVSIHEADLDRLASLIRYYQARRCVILGDLFHSEFNREWQLLNKLMDENPRTSFELIPGNHDLLRSVTYERLIIHDEVHNEGPFLLTHTPPERVEPNKTYAICGHLHPAVAIRTGPRQSQRADCFWFGRDVGVLPAFGKFTGRYVLPPECKKRDTIFAIADDQVLPL